MVASLDYISVCLINTGKGTPFISALELRLLDNSTYQAANESQSLRLYTRLDPGSTSGKRIRYPDDDYDRIWSPWVENFWTPINTSFSINLRNHVGYQPALALQNNQSREFSFSIDGRYVYGPFSPKYLSVGTIFITSPLSGQTQHVVDLYKTTSSTLPPILNAVEIYTVKQLTSPTDGQDVDAIMNIKAIYQIKRNWMGDPCLPVNYSWNGLSCSYPYSSSPTIISLDLSSSGLTGELAPSLANLTSIRSLDVSNNSLTGPVPDFLAQLSSLKILKLTNNQFTGPIPAILLEKSKDGSLSLSFDNNTNLSGLPDINHCEDGSCKKRTKDSCSYTSFIYFSTSCANNYGFCTSEIYTKEKTKREKKKAKLENANPYCNKNKALAAHCTKELKPTSTSPKRTRKETEPTQNLDYPNSLSPPEARLS
ncbi:hypothetical protein MRB53_012815 [Persea americana]|uniref:Uncharacterized protein n=1 Tax=Persea americana TaxID=3435 RepID=A0ACC2LZB1_PERAE|nr:hypothetical protein MRB53_012815 [Persea americana]